MRDAIILYYDGNRGIYIPQHFADDSINWQGITEEQREELRKGPDYEWYWDVWNDVLDNATYTDEHGHVWQLWQDGDLWAYCVELMTNEEYENFFGEMKPAPENWVEYEVCQNCLIALANDDYSGMDDAEEEATRQGLDELYKKYEMVVPDGAEYGFKHYHCECCGALPGDRYRVLCKPFGETKMNENEMYNRIAELELELDSACKANQMLTESLSVMSARFNERDVQVAKMQVALDSSNAFRESLMKSLGITDILGRLDELEARTHTPTEIISNWVEDGDFENRVRDVISNYMDDELDERVEDSVRELNFEVRVSRY